MEFFNALSSLAVSLFIMLVVAGFGFYVFDQMINGEDYEFNKWPVVILILIWFILAYQIYYM